MFDLRRQEKVKMADFYFESCVQFYCGTCFDMHSRLFTKHASYGKGEKKKWPVSKKVEDFLLKCDVHKEENLKMFCDKHSELCCTNCAFINHRRCQRVTLISDIVKSQSRDLQQLSVSIQTFLKEMKELQENQEASIRSVQSSYDEQLHTIHKTRQEINAALDTIEQNTIKEMKDALTKLQAAFKSDVDKCIRLRDELKQLRDAIQDISNKSKLELSFIATRKCKEKMQQSEAYLKNNSLQVKVAITFQPNSEIVQYLSKLSGLRKIERSTKTLIVKEDPNRVITVKGQPVHNVKISKDSEECCITATLFSDRQVLVVDNNNKNVKLLDQQYQVVSHWSATAFPRDICAITPGEVAVTLGDENTHEVQFITVNKRQLVSGKTLQLKHTCKVEKCAVSPTGDKLYITDYSENKLLTLARDGSVLATFTDQALLEPCDVHVTPAGQVLVCGMGSHTILQVDCEGRRKLATLATKMDGVLWPWAVCYSRHSASIIVGLYGNNSILVFKVQ